MNRILIYTIEDNSNIKKRFPVLAMAPLHTNSFPSDALATILIAVCLVVRIGERLDHSP